MGTTIHIPNVDDLIALRRTLQQIAKELESIDSGSYSDSDAIEAINSDDDHGSTALHNYASSPGDVNLGNLVNSLQVINAGNAISLQTGLAADRPAAGTQGRYYKETDSNQIFWYDDGSSWVEVARPAGQITASSLGFDPATQTELESHASNHTDGTDDIQNATGSQKGLMTNTQATKVGYLTVTAATDLDTIRQRVNELDASIVLQGDWDASTGSFPGGGSAKKGQTWIVSTAGTVDGIDFSVNDRILAITDNASTSTYTDNWLKLDYTDQVLSVFGRTGAVTAQEGDYNVAKLADAALPDAMAAGQLLIWNATNSQFENALLSSGNAISITNVDGSVTIAVDTSQLGPSDVDLGNVLNKAQVAQSDFTQDGGFLVGTGAGTYQEETGIIARASLGLGTGDNVQFNEVKSSKFQAPDSNGVQLVDDAGNGLTVADGGDMGIGTASPSNPGGFGHFLQINDAGGSALYLADDANMGQVSYFGNSLLLFNRASGDLRFGTNGTERERINSSGDHAINRTSASAKLDVQGDGGNVLQARNNSGNTRMRLKNDNDFDLFEYNSFPRISMYGKYNTPSNKDIAGIIRWFSKNDAGEDVFLAEIRSQITNIADGAEDSDILIKMQNNGTSGYPFKFKGNGNFNLSGNLKLNDTNIYDVYDIYSKTDGRIVLRSQGPNGILGAYDDNSGNWVWQYKNNTQDLCFNPSNSVGIGTTDPSVLLNIYGGGSPTRLKLSNNDTGNGRTSDGFDLVQDGTAAYIIQRENDFLKFYTNNTSRMEISKDGITSTPQQSSVKMYLSSSQSISDSMVETIVFDTDSYDEQNESDTSTGKITVTRDGKYNVYAIIQTGILNWSDGTQCLLRLYVNGALNSESIQYITQGNNMSFDIFSMIELSAADTVYVTIYHNAGSSASILGYEEHTNLTVQKVA